MLPLQSELSIRDIIIIHCTDSITWLMEFIVGRINPVFAGFFGIGSFYANFENFVISSDI